MKHIKYLVLLFILTFTMAAEKLNYASRVVRWKSSSTNEYVVKYNVYWKNLSIRNAPTNMLSSRTNYCLIKYLILEDKYTFWVKAENVWGQEGKSSVVVTQKLYYDK